jgi:hypothetical protein
LRPVNGVLTEYGHHPYKNGVLFLQFGARGA